MKKVFIFMAGFLLIAANLYAGSGDLIVNGKLGVGTTSPGYKLDVQSQTPLTLRLDSDDTSDNLLSMLDSDGDEWKINARGNVFDDLAISNTNALFFIKKTSGNVGIGVEYPGAKLEVAGVSSGNYAGIFRGDNGQWAKGLKVLSGNGIDGGTGYYSFFVGDYNETLGYFVVKPDGKVGIGTTSPGYKLTIKESSATAEQLALVAVDGDAFVIGTTGDNFYIKDKRVNATRIFLRYDGRVGIGTETPGYRLDVAGDINAVNIYGNVGSSRELKDNIADLPTQEALEAIKNLSPVKFIYKADEKKDLHIGFIAEDVPELVATPERKGINTMDIVAVLTKVVQAQQEKITALEAEQQTMKNQQAMISALFEKVNELEKQVRSQGTVALVEY